MTNTTIERAIREAHPHEREAVIALTLAAYQQYDASMPSGAWQFMPPPSEIP